MQGRVVDLTDAEPVRAFFAQVGEIDHLILPRNEVPHRAVPEAFHCRCAGVDGQQILGTIRGRQGGSDGACRLRGAFLRCCGSINAAVEALGKALAVELAPVRVNVIAPGIVETELWAGLPEEARAAALKSFTEGPAHRAARTARGDCGGRPEHDDGDIHDRRCRWRNAARIEQNGSPGSRRRRAAHVPASCLRRRETCYPSYIIQLLKESG